MDTHAAPPLRARPLGPTFGAELSGLTVRGDVGEAELAAFREALHRYGVVLIRGVANDPAAQVAFSRRLGPLEHHAAAKAVHPLHPEIFCVGNYRGEGITANFARGVEQWHADSSYREVPSLASLFYGAICPPEGGETCFLDAVTAYAELPEALKAELEGKIGVHDLGTLSEWNHRHTPDRLPMTQEARRRWPPVPHPLVKTHPVTGKRTLFICPAVISHVEGMSAEAGRALIEAVMQHATQERYIYRHQWREGDLVAWDNRATLHTASLFDHTKYTRLMFRTTVAGEA
ncbi:TauD/TfdA family dioxygenase [Siccirubricoccus sp. KC 17139]|uniref:TauD/TfdA family dioxygenase n=1 Tax=Siccirubricoccus soli TaxID=2899147 RepID=A0ABT1DC77_9PROT|nr:TauD/TfdA family dioxygenase [Siccirubricoccus soli]MCO6419533.1 TauD/TfdA family dioxygenase [Siccirubricoccus soli]MCP2685668.1 TauD/TfdA family dioxygenase [Siccirubricoccus soli]